MMMDSVLVVSGTEKSTALIMEFLSQNPCKEIVTVKNCGEARRLLVERDFDLCIVNTPLTDEFGVQFSIHTAMEGICQVIVLVKSELFDEVSSKVEDYGVLTVAKPMNRQVFWSALKLAAASFRKAVKLKNENNKLLQKIDDLRLVDRAKCILIQYLKMNEAEAHRYIEKQAMDMRMSKRQIAEGILKTYES
jgi:AmiR/NasT family two-component response regulator